MQNQLPSEADMEDAIQHADTMGDSGWSVKDFTLKFLGDLTPAELSQYDDISAWLDVHPSDFEGLGTEEKFRELESFRGKDWALRAREWLKTGIPPIIVIDAPDLSEPGSPYHLQIGDGRGRTNFALAFGLQIPTYLMKLKQKKKTAMNKQDLVKMIRESVAKALMEFDPGDNQLQNSSKADQLLKQTDELLDALKGLARALHKKQDGQSLEILRALNASLGPFVTKVTTSVRAGRL